MEKSATSGNYRSRFSLNFMNLGVDVELANEVAVELSLEVLKEGSF